jgi:hypothetical protein
MKVVEQIIVDQEYLEKQLNKWKRRYEMERGLSVELDMMNLNVIRNIEDMLMTEILEQEIFND